VQQLEGLQNLLKYASLNMELKADKWPDLNVTTWPMEECITSSLLNSTHNLFLQDQFAKSMPQVKKLYDITVTQDNLFFHTISLIWS
jgi:hypothetical protein